MYADLYKSESGLYWASLHYYAGGCLSSTQHQTKQSALEWIASYTTDVFDSESDEWLFVQPSYLA